MKTRHNAGFAVGSFILVLILIAAIAAVIFMFFIPKNDYNKAYDNVVEFQSIYYEKEINNKNFDYYWQQVLTFENVSSEQRSELYDYNTIITVFLDMKNNSLTALSNIDRDSDYKILLAEQNKNLKAFRESKNEVNDYIENGMEGLFRYGYTGGNIDDYVWSLMNRVKSMVQDMSRFCHSTVEIIDNCSERTDENNELVVTALYELNSACSRLLSTYNIDGQDIVKLREQADVMLLSDFYTKQYSGEYTLLSVRTILNNICGTYTPDYDYDNRYEDDNSYTYQKDARQNVVDFQSIYYEYEISNRNFDYYWEQVLQLTNVSGIYRSELYDYNTIISVLLDMRNNSLTALSKVNRDTNYYVLIPEQSRYLQMFRNSKNAVNDYLEDNMKYLNSSNCYNIDYYVCSLMNKVKSMVRNMASFYYATADIISCCSERTYVSNDIVVTALYELNKTCLRLLNASSIDGQDIIKIREQADIMLVSTFYAKQYTKEYTSSKVWESLYKICNPLYS